MAVAYFLLALLCAPLLSGVIGYASSLAGGRKAVPPTRGYTSLAALAGAGTAYPEGTSLLSRLTPAVSLGCVGAALLFMPGGGQAPMLGFTGDYTLVVFFLILARMIVFTASEEGGPIYRPVHESTGKNGGLAPLFRRLAPFFGEPLLLLVFMPLGLAAGSYSLGGMLSSQRNTDWHGGWPVLLPAALALFFLVLAEWRSPSLGDCDRADARNAGENGAPPPGGLDRALRDYGRSLKLWLLAAAFGGLFPPAAADPAHGFAAGVGGLFAVAVVAGVLDGFAGRKGNIPAFFWLACAALCALVACVAAAVSV